MKMTSFIKTALTRLFTSADEDVEEDSSSLSEIAPITGQNRQRNLFRLAVAFAKEEIKNPRKKQFYASHAKSGQHAFNVAVSMYLNFFRPHTLTSKATGMARARS